MAASTSIERNERPTVDFMILADRAEALNGKLYLMGGAWNEITIQDLDAPVGISFAVGILVPWNATNEQHKLSMVIVDDDGKVVENFRVDSNFTVGRPPHAKPGAIQRIVLAVPAVLIKFPEAGTYIVRTKINDESSREVQFTLLPMSGPPLT